MKYLKILFVILMFFAASTSAHAQVQDYTITNFNSKITVSRDTSLLVEEKIDVNFAVQKHGIYRTVPIVYSSTDKTINSRFELISIKDEKGTKYKYKTRRSGSSIQIKIGDEKRFVTGNKTYVISYRMRNILQRFDTSDELYWNVVGNDWDTTIQNAQAEVTTNFAEIISLKCVTGEYGSTESNCISGSDLNRAHISSTQGLASGEGLTIKVNLKTPNALVYKRGVRDLIKDYWAYPLSVIPVFAMFLFWFKKGRDKRFKTDNLYYETNAAVENTPVFLKREYLPLVYSPIQGLTPAEVGTLVDERVDVHDVVAEITELGRLGYLTIEKVDKKFAKDDYTLKRTTKKAKGLKDYQSYLLEELFALGEAKDIVNLSELKQKFYPKLAIFRNMLYMHLKKQGYFPSRPDHVRAIWIGISVALCAIAIFASFIFLVDTMDAKPLLFTIIGSIPTIVLGYQMPRRTAKGYALFRQIKGLSFYLGKGKWREDVKEKHLFLDEVLPLAISLGVVSKLAKDMKELGVKPPSYFKGSYSSWPAVITGFNASASSSFVPSSSSGGWSGGSGGASSGGGFGGGGGGSW